jgi:hypothetical protein
MTRGAAILVVTLLAVSRAPAGGMGEATRRELAELKALCDAGVVAPAVCLEKQRAILGLAPTAPATVPAGATLHESPLGFRVALPPGWTVVSPEEVEAGFAALRSRLDGQPEAARLLDRMRAQGHRTDAEFFAKGPARVQVTRSTFSPPEDAGARARFCERLEASTSQAAGRRLRTYACDSRLVSGSPAFHVERDALLPGTRTIQFWVRAPDGGSVHFVASCPEVDAARARKDVEGIVESLAWQ